VLNQGIESVSMLAFVAGLMILLAYFLHFERYLIFIPSSVIHGFTLGVACIIGFSQINFAFGLRDLPAHKELIKNIGESLRHSAQFSSTTFLVFLAFFMAHFVLRRYILGVPPAVILAPLGILLGYTTPTLSLETLGNKYGTLHMQLFHLSPCSFSPDILWPAFIVALIAIIETILSAKIADGLTKTKHNGHQELLGLSLANICSGLVGGIPATAALARTVLNVKTGATSNMSAILSSTFIAALSCICLPYFIYMPMAVIAAILVHVAIGMIERQHFARLFAHDKINFSISILVAIITVYKDPIIGIFGGAVISLLFFVEKLSHGHYEVTRQTIEGHKEEYTPHDVLPRAQKTDVLVYTFKGKLSYLNSQSHVVRFETDFNTYHNVILNMEDVFFIDIDGIDAIDEIIEIMLKKNKKVALAAINPLIKNLLLSISGQCKKLEKNGLLFETVDDAYSMIQK
jgi:SulP family sulfate permease